MQQRATASSGRLTAATSGSDSEEDSPGLAGRRRGGAISSRVDAGLPHKVVQEEPSSPIITQTPEEEAEE